MEWITNVQAVLSLIAGLVGVITTGITAFFAIRAAIKNNKAKSFAEIWSLVMKLADAAMVEAEKSNKAGEDKKDIVLNAVAAAAKESGIDITPFTNQLSTYIDQTIGFVNKLTKENK